MTNHSAKPEVDEGQPLKLPPDSYLKMGTMHIFIKASVARGSVFSCGAEVNFLFASFVAYILYIIFDTRVIASLITWSICDSVLPKLFNE